MISCDSSSDNSEQEGMVYKNKKRKLESGSDYESDICKTDSEVKYPKFDQARSSKEKDPYAKKEIMEDLSATLDRVSQSNRKATQVLAAVARCENKKSKTIAISCSTIRRTRIKHRLKIAKNINTLLLFDPVGPLVGY